LGLAFSRDTDKKVYIQHKIQEDAELLAKLLGPDNGAFFLCGPSEIHSSFYTLHVTEWSLTTFAIAAWPVPDVYEALIKSFTEAGKSVEEAQNYIEEMKEDERYVLEVYVPTPPFVVVSKIVTDFFPFSSSPTLLFSNLLRNYSY
jgi:sulfite reductase (NADPH) flavoprotein alpha-component